LKEKLYSWLTLEGYEVFDVGAETYDKGDDYTKYAEAVSVRVRGDKESYGILLCGSGVGVDIVANKFDGVRASIGISPEQVAAGRRDDDMNVLVIAADYTKEIDAKEMIKAFLETKFDEAARHKRRLEDISRIEENN